MRGRLRARAVRRRHAGLADRPQLRQPDDPHLRRRAATASCGARSTPSTGPRPSRATSTSWSGRSSTSGWRRSTGAGRGRSDGGVLRAGLGAQPRRGARARRRRRRDPAALVRGARRRRRPTSSATRKSRRTATPPAPRSTSALGPLLDRLEREPDDSTISHMIRPGVDDGRPRPRERYLPSLKVILLGGMQEPGHGAGSVLYALLAHPEQLAEVRGRPRRACSRRRSTRACAGSRRSAPRAGGRRAEVELGGRRAAGRRPGRRGDRGRQPRPGALRRPRPLRHPPRAAAAWRRSASAATSAAGMPSPRAQERIALRALLERYARAGARRGAADQRLGVPGAARAARPVAAMRTVKWCGSAERPGPGRGYSALADREAVLDALTR